jgi:hypothetical protein
MIYAKSRKAVLSLRFTNYQCGIREAGEDAPKNDGNKKEGQIRD